MTENEAIGIIENTPIFRMEADKTIHSDLFNALAKGCIALEEIQQYKVLGTVEELRIVKEKQIEKKPVLIDYKKYMNVIDNAIFLKGGFWCPNCNHVIRSGTYCNDCGQKLDWSDEE